MIATMSTLGRVVGVAGTLVMMIPASPSAQSAGCDPNSSAQACFTAHSSLASARQRTAATKAIEDGTAAKPTGSQANIPGSETAIKDFLPRFASALAIPGLSALPKALGLRLNVKPNDPVWRLPMTLQLEGVANEPKLSDALVNNVPQRLRSVVQDSVTKTLSDFDDLGFSLAFNFESQRWGRSIASNRAAINLVMGELFADDARQLNQRLAALIAVLAAAAPPGAACGAVARINMPLSCFAAGDREAIVDTLLSLSQTFNDFEAKARLKLEQTHLDRIEDLLNGQPQLNVTGQAKARDRLVGPNEQKASLRFEWSPVNLNAARDFCKGRLALKCVSDYLAQEGILTALDRGHRFWFTTDFSNVAHYDFALPADSARVTKARSLAIEPVLGYGSYLGVADQKVRLDFELRYRRSDDQSVREDRLTSTATFTQKVSDQSNAIFTLKWANKPEFLGDVDRKWRANIGYSYKVSDADK